MSVLRSVAACPCLDTLLPFSPLLCRGCDLELPSSGKFLAPSSHTPWSFLWHTVLLLQCCRLFCVQDIVACLSKALPGPSPSPQSACDPCICFMTEYRPLSTKHGLSTWHPLCKGSAGKGHRPQCYWDSSLASQNLKSKPFLKCMH